MGNSAFWPARLTSQLNPSGVNGALRSLTKTNVQAGRTRPGLESQWSRHTPEVLVRITEVPAGYGQAGKVREQITQFNNTQNTVKVSDFRSNDRVQEALKEQFAKIHRRGRQV